MDIRAHWNFLIDIDALMVNRTAPVIKYIAASHRIALTNISTIRMLLTDVPLVIADMRCSLFFEILFIQILLRFHFFYDSAAEDVIIFPASPIAGFSAAEYGILPRTCRQLFSADMIAAYFQKAAIRIFHTFHGFAFALQIAERLFEAAF